MRSELPETDLCAIRIVENKLDAFRHEWFSKMFYWIEMHYEECSWISWMRSGLRYARTVMNHVMILEFCIVEVELTKRIESFVVQLRLYAWDLSQGCCEVEKLLFAPKKELIGCIKIVFNSMKLRLEPK